jgi:hypothetical protein
MYLPKWLISTTGLSFGGQEVILLHAHRDMIKETGNGMNKNFGRNLNFILNNYSPTSASQIHTEIIKSWGKMISVNSDL